MDFKAYQDLAPGNLVYDGTEKTYRPNIAFNPLFFQISADIISDAAVVPGCGSGGAGGHLAEDHSGVSRLTAPGAGCVARGLARCRAGLGGCAGC